MDLESTRLFNDRLAQWVAKQGFWFQIRYSMAGGGASVLMYHLLRIFLRVGIFALIVAAVLLYMLMKRTEQASFQKDLQAQIVSGLDCTSGKMRSFDRTQNKASIRYLTLEGGPRSFMHSCEASGISFRMGLLDGITSVWDLNQIAVDRLSVHVKAGAETDQEAKEIGASLVKNFENVRFQSLECKSTRISWGYSPRTMGSITGSHMTMIRDGGGWRLRFVGGMFSQNWLRNMQIDELVVRCDDQMLIVEKAEFTVLRPLKEVTATKTHGKVIFQNVVVRGGTRPEYAGSVSFENVPLENMLPDTYANYAEGSISGQLKIQGSTNSPDGVSLSGRISLAENDHIDIRNRVHILNSLSILSPSGSYRKTSFQEGSFTIKTTGGSLQVSDINLSAPDQMDLRGAFLVRPPNENEIDEMRRKGMITSEHAKEIAMPGMTAARLIAEQEISSRKTPSAVADGGNAEISAADKTSFDLGIPFNADAIQMDLQMKTSELLATTSIYEGQVVMTLPVSLFSESAVSLNRIPVSENGQFYILNVPLLGTLFDLTLAQAESLLIVRKAEPKPEEDTVTEP